MMSKDKCEREWHPEGWDGKRNVRRVFEFGEGG